MIQDRDATGFYIIFQGEVLITHKLKSTYKEKLNFSNHLILKEEENEEFLESIPLSDENKEETINSAKF